MLLAAAKSPTCDRLGAASPIFVDLPFTLRLPGSLFTSRAPVGLFFTNVELPGGKATETAILAAYTQQSRAAFRTRTVAVLAGGYNKPNASVNDFLTILPGEFAAAYRGLSVSKKNRPTATESTKPGGLRAFVDRGGYLLWIDPTRGVVSGQQPIANFYLYGDPAKPETQQAGYAPSGGGASKFRWSVYIARENDGWAVMLRPRPEGGLIDTVIDWVGNVGSGYKALAAKVCTWSRGDAGAVANIAASADAKAAATSRAVQAGCALLFPPSAPAPTTTPGGAAPAPVQKYPIGSIAFTDREGRVHVAAPLMTLDSPFDAPSHAEVSVEATIPSGVRAVTKQEYQNKTRPWYQRTWAIAAAIVGGAAAVGGGIFYYRRHST